MLGASGRLVIVEHDGLVRIVLAGTVHPRVAVGSGLSSVADDLKGRFVCVDQLMPQKRFAQFFIKDGEVQLGRADHPVCHGVGKSLMT